MYNLYKLTILWLFLKILSNAKRIQKPEGKGDNIFLKYNNDSNAFYVL